MRRLHRLRLWLRDLLGRNRFEQDMRGELDAYLDEATRARIRSGFSKEEARRQALLELGGLEQAKEALREVRTGHVLESVWQDCRHAVRRMRRQPAFTVVAVLTLALGIGANTAILSVVQSVLLAPLPFSQADRLVRLRLLAPDATGGERQLSLVPAYFHEVQARSRLIERAAAQRFQDATLSVAGAPERIVATGVGAGWAETLGVRPVLGRTFSDGEQRDGDAARVAVLGHSLWTRQFNGDPAVLGRPVRLNDEVYTLIGVMPPAFRYPYNTELWFPVSVDRQAMTPGDLNVPARMRPGVTVEQLNAELADLSRILASEYGRTDSLRIAAVPMDEEFARDPNNSVLALAVAVGFVLLLACVNLATLLLARRDRRVREVALRAALGATRWRQVRQLLTESVLLSSAGGIAGVALAVGTSRWLGMLIPPRLGEVIQQVHVDGTVLAGSAALCVLTGVLFGLTPALQTTRASERTALRSGGRPGSAAGGRLLSALVIGEAALAMVLVAGAGLMAQNFARLLGSDVGYDPAGLMRINLSLASPVYEDADQRRTIVRQLVDQVDRIPGVRAAGVTSLQPVPRTRANLGTLLQPDTLIDDTARLPVVNRRLVTPGYLEAVGVIQLRGRGIISSDSATSAPVVVINQAAAERFWPGADPVGRRVRPADRDATGVPWHTVVGVVSNMAEPDDEAMPETIYQPYDQAAGTLPTGVWITTTASLLVRSALDPAVVVAAVRDTVAEVDPGMPLYDISTLDRALAEPLADQQLGATLFVAFGGFGLLMAVLGTYGVIAVSVSRRIPEFGVRLALGAAPRGLLGGVLVEGLRLVGAGLVVGTVAALLLSRLMASVLTEISPHDPGTLVVVGAVLFVAGGLASLVPAWRATRVDPVSALRAE